MMMVVVMVAMKVINVNILIASVFLVICLVSLGWYCYAYYHCYYDDDDGW